MCSARAIGLSDDFFRVCLKHIRWSMKVFVSFPAMMVRERTFASRLVDD